MAEKFKLKKSREETPQLKKEEEQAEKEEQAFEEEIAAGLEQLEGLDDSHRVVVDNFPERGAEYAVGELKRLIQTMRDKNNPLTRGAPLFIYVISANPEEYYKEQERHLERRKQFLLGKFAPYPDDLLITYVHPNSNSYTDWSTGKVMYYQKTAGQLRKIIKDMDWEESEQLSHAGGIEIVSDNPNVSLEELEERTEENSKLFREMLQATINRVNAKIIAQDKLRESIKNLPDDAMVSFASEDGNQSSEVSVKELKARLGL